MAKDRKLQKTDEIVGVSIISYYGNDCNGFIKFLDLKNHSYIHLAHLKDEESNKLLKLREGEIRTTVKRLILNKYIIFMNTN